MLPAERYISALPDYEQFGRKTNLRLNPNKIPDLQWELTDKLNTTQIGISHTNQINVLDVYEEISINSIYVNICSYAKSTIDHNTYCITTENRPRLSVLIVQ